MEPQSTLAERVLLALVRSGDELVGGDRDVTPELAQRDAEPVDVQALPVTIG
jgi:hypothetical protein